ncbi:SDR family NAD(P)-dependent oxidoreductase [Nocardia asteroides]|uniref:SDR family NAD(P)-dependent oxidoreductase n=1 Tax=Nocardia asteroides TaxID=1824 RepID=UPI0037CB5831
MSKVWFVTGSSRGFGRRFVEAALSRGDRVAATARDTSSLDDLVATYGSAILPLSLDVTDRDAVFAVVERAAANFGRLDIVVNNAGHGLFGAIEEVTEDALRAQFEVGVFGATWVTQAVLPILRAQHSGHIVQISSTGGVLGWPTVGAYNGAKWAMEGMSEALAQEVSHLGISVTLVEPGAYATDWGGSSAVHSVPNPAYDPAREGLAAFMSTLEFGDPDAAAQALLTVVDAPQPPLRVFFGTQGNELVPQVYADRLAGWQQWQSVSVAAQRSVAAVS